MPQEYGFERIVYQISNDQALNLQCLLKLSTTLVKYKYFNTVFKMLNLPGLVQ